MPLPTAPQHIIALGRAYVRLIEAAQAIMGYTEHDGERERLRQLVQEYQAGLRQLVGTVPPHVTAEIMAASETILGPVKEHGAN
jgi:hypothetical protein